MSRDGAQLASRLHEAYNAHDADAAGRLYAPDGRHVEIATGGERSGPEAIADGLRGLLAAFPDARWEERMLIAEGDRAAIGYVLTGTLTEAFGPFEPNGQRLELPGVHLVSTAGGEITRCEDYWDAASFGRQMRG
ncbi:ester cyclase [Capillimicrobium parvum]|uniref:SnoaL-like domain-containing protein n=1 Tax=Capillimicrobium parvum TaxID=2884022 RepID=A0A9E7C0S5_9ACTN|nr:ester cyclase [Capillimicrobium parvum]UGS35924.1 hypothetical protein DSM104329_02321 [Capillimicrobium parvum]